MSANSNTPAEDLEHTAIILDSIKDDLEKVVRDVIMKVESINYRNPRINYLLSDFEEDCAYLVNSINDLYPLYVNQFAQYCHKKERISR